MQSQEATENKAVNENEKGTENNAVGENNEGTKNKEERNQTEKGMQSQENKQADTKKQNQEKNSTESSSNQGNNSTEHSSQTQAKKEGGSNYSINLAIVGGVVGAGIGLFANRETSKKVIRSLSESEFVKIAGQEFRKTAHEILAGQAQSSVKQLASGYLSKIEQSLLSPKNSGSNNSAGQDQPYEEIKEENKNLNERLQKIEKMLGDLVESK